MEDRDFDASDSSGSSGSTAVHHVAPGQLAAILEALHDVVFRLEIEPDGYRFSYVNASFLHATGLRRDQVVGQRVEDVIPEPSLHLVLTNYARALQTGEAVRWLESTPYPSGLKHGEVTVCPIHDGEGRIVCLVGTVHDVTAAYEHEERLHELAYSDSLTGLPNRRHFYMLLHEQLATHPGNGLALLYIDLAIHNINDTYGHDCGDEVLKQAAARIIKELGEHVLVARVAGDELAILLPRTEDLRDIADTAAMALSRLEAPFRLPRQEAMITPSIGVALFPQDADDADNLFRAGNAAMHAAKRAGRSTVRFYDRVLATRIRQRITLRNQLQQALEHGEFELHYQPQVDVRSGQCTALEALLRWNRPGHGLQRPQTFIDVLEQSSLIIPVGYWVIETACRQIKAWREAGLPPVAVSINLSARQILAQSVSVDDAGAPDGGTDNLLQRLSDCIAHYDIAPGQLELELTETSLMTDPERSSSLLAQFRGLGLRLLIDDFGTGYSSLAYLRRLPIDMLKIDRVFVHDINTPGDAVSQGAAIADLIIKLSQDLGIGVVAEGVETPAQADYLRARGCDRLQGYYLARPMRTDAVPGYLRGLAGGDAP